MVRTGPQLVESAARANKEAKNADESKGEEPWKSRDVVKHMVADIRRYLGAVCFQWKLTSATVRRPGALVDGHRRREVQPAELCEVAGESFRAAGAGAE